MVHGYRPWQPSGASRHASNSSRNRRLGPRFESLLGITISIIQNLKQPIGDTLSRSTAQGSNGRGYRPLTRVRGRRSHQSKSQMEGQKGEDNRKKWNMAFKRMVNGFCGNVSKCWNCLWQKTRLFKTSLNNYGTWDFFDVGPLKQDIFLSPSMVCI